MPDFLKADLPAKISLSALPAWRKDTVGKMRKKTADCCTSVQISGFLDGPVDCMVGFQSERPEASSRIHGSSAKNIMSKFGSGKSGAPYG